MELIPALERVIAAGFPCVINVGAGTGYYVVGFAVRMPRAQIIAFETEEVSREQCARVAALNGASARIDLRGFCTPATLQQALAGNSAALLQVRVIRAVVRSIS